MDCYAYVSSFNVCMVTDFAKVLILHVEKKVETNGYKSLIFGSVTRA